MTKPCLIYFPLPMQIWQEIIVDLTNNERAALENLIIRYATMGFLPLDDVSLAHIARVQMPSWRRMRGKLALKFPGEHWRWPEIDHLIERRKNIGEKRARLGSIGGSKRVINTITLKNRLS